MNKIYLLLLVLAVTFLNGINTCLAETSPINNKEEDWKIVSFNKAAPMFVEILEQQYLSTGQFGQTKHKVRMLLERSKKQGFTERAETEYLYLMNDSRTLVANYLGLSVFDLPEFFDYFYSNITVFITPDSLLFDPLVGSVRIYPIEIIEVKCNGSHCNDPSSFWLQSSILYKFVAHGINAGQSAHVDVVDDNDNAYSNTTGTWRHNNYGDIELVTTRPCETCQLH